MPDRSGFWPVIPRHLQGAGLSLTLLDPVPQLLVSGDLDAACARFDLAAPVGLLGRAEGPRATIRLARARMLVTGLTLDHADAGGHHGFAVTPATGALAVLAIDGPRALNLIARGTAIDLRAGSPSAALILAGIEAVLYRRDAGLRLHLDAGLVDYLLDWAQASGALAAG